MAQDAPRPSWGEIFVRSPEWRAIEERQNVTLLTSNCDTHTPSFADLGRAPPAERITAEAYIAWLATTLAWDDLDDDEVSASTTSLTKVL